MSEYGKLTLKGSKEFEIRMTTLLDNIKYDIKNTIKENLYEAVILIGGYGRSEGGVIKINNKEYPHNNLDFIIISKKINKKEEIELNNQLKDIFNTNVKEFKIFVEFSIISAEKLKNCTPLVITYDMKYGHKLIIGNADSLINNNNFELENIPSWDVRNLMVNRGTLLIINDLILKKTTLDIKDKKTIIKHLMKAIIGYGDALLFYLGEYNYSYLTKQKRMRENKYINDDFKKLYEEAINFRFQARYENYLDINLQEFQFSIKKQLFEIHHKCETLALHTNNLKWSKYLNVSVKQSLYKNIKIRNILKNIYFLTKKAPILKNLSFWGNIEIKMLGMQKLMPIIFPFIAYDIKTKQSQALLSDFFNIKKQESYKKEYLQYWKKYINSNYEEKDFKI